MSVMKSQIVINTERNEGINSSLGKLFGVKKSDIDFYILDNFKEITSKEYYELNLLNFYEFIKESKGKVTIEKNFYITAFHLTKRINPFNGEKIFNLYNALINDTEIRSFFEENDITFKENSNKMQCFYKGNLVDWLAIEDSSVTRMIISRLEGGNVRPADKCVNGMLFEYKMEEDSDIKILAIAPEIVQHILEVLDLENEIKKYELKYLYKIKFKLKFEDLIFDYYSNENEEEKFDRLLKLLLYNSCLMMTNNQEKIKNIMIRTFDNKDIEKEDVIDAIKIDSPY